MNTKAKNTVKAVKCTTTAKKSVKSNKKAVERVADVTERPAQRQFLDGLQKDINLSKYYSEHPLQPVPEHERALTLEQAVELSAKIGNLMTFVQAVVGVLPPYLNGLAEFGRNRKNFDNKMVKCFAAVKVLQQRCGALNLSIGEINSCMNDLVKDRNAQMENVRENTKIANDMLSIALDCQPDGQAMPHKEVLIRMPLALLNSLSIVDEVWRMNEVKIYGLPEPEKPVVKKKKATQKKKTIKTTNKTKSK